MSDWISETACAKLNVALHIIGRRPDSYHELDSIVAFASFGDELKLRKAKANTLSIIGPFAKSVPLGKDNIIFAAIKVLGNLMQRELPAVEIVLEKNLPVASGLGGGSADAAATLRGLSRLISEKLSPTQVTSLAISLGADVPVCFLQKSCRMQGIGEIISPLTIELPKAVVLINPNHPCSTQAVFAALGLKNGEAFGTPLQLENPPLWRNDLAPPACLVLPEIVNVLNTLQREPCFSAVRMTGSGATCFGLSNSMAEASAAAARLSVRNPNWWVRAAELL